MLRHQSPFVAATDESPDFCSTECRRSIFLIIPKSDVVETLCRNDIESEQQHKEKSEAATFFFRNDTS